MTQNPPQSRPMSDTHEIVTDFMLAEFNALQERARGFDQINASRINFFLIIVAAVGAGFGAATDLKISLSYYLWGVVLAFLALLVLGLVTLYYAVNSAIATVELYRYAGRIRCWFADLAPEAVSYFAFAPADNRPRFTTRFWMLRGGEAIVVAINAILASSLAMILSYQVADILLISEPLWTAILVGIVLGPAIWLLQRWLIKKRMEWAESSKSTQERIHFPYQEYEALFTGDKDIA